jgi:hypothetical protein
MKTFWQLILLDFKHQWKTKAVLLILDGIAVCILISILKSGFGLQSKLMTDYLLRQFPSAAVFLVSLVAFSLPAGRTWQLFHDCELQNQFRAAKMSSSKLYAAFSCGIQIEILLHVVLIGLSYWLVSGIPITFGTIILFCLVLWLLATFLIHLGVIAGLLVGKTEIIIGFILFLVLPLTLWSVVVGNVFQGAESWALGFKSFIPMTRMVHAGQAMISGLSFGWLEFVALLGLAGFFYGFANHLFTRKLKR